MELLQLHYFRIVAKHEHMTRAAGEIRIAQPALSKSIARLEEDLGVRLFDRNGRSIRLNAYGKAFLAKVDVALGALEEGRREVVEMAGLEREQVSLALATHQTVSGLIGAFLADHPHVRVLISQSAVTEEGVNRLRAGEIDFLITYLPLEEPDIACSIILDEAVSLAVPRGHRFSGRSGIALAEVAEEPFIGMMAGNPFRRLTDGFCHDAGFRPKVVCEVDDLSLIPHYLEMGFGVALLPECFLAVNRKSLSIVPIHTPACRRVTQIAWLQRRSHTRAIRQFLDHASGYFTSMNE